MTLTVMSRQPDERVLIQHTAQPDLQRISGETLSSLLDNQLNNLLIIDARYPFEYAGGHIISAHNIYTDDDLRLLFTKLITSSTCPSIIIFHCEFSSKRAPHLYRLFRSLDRQYNLSSYPQLSFPSIYLLDGGYAQFYNHSLLKKYCQPIGYVSMFEKQHTQELQIYRQAKKVANGKIMTKKFFEPIEYCLS